MFCIINNLLEYLLQFVNFFFILYIFILLLLHFYYVVFFIYLDQIQILKKKKPMIFNLLMKKIKIQYI